MAHDQDPAYVLTAGALFPPLCIIAVALRFYTRRVQKLELRLDDWLLLPSLVSVW
jgi:hypothetical protein